MIEFQNVSFSYESGTPVLQNLSFTIGAGESVGLIGANGAGKSTIMKVLLGLLPCEGAVTVDGLAVNRQNLGEVRKKLGFVLQNSDNQMFMPTVYEDMMFAPRNYGLSKEEAEARVDRVLAELGLELPGGNKPEPRDYAELLESVADRPDAEMLQTMLLRSMKQAIYDPENRGHFGLALQSYAHFTSPIRRYPDLTLHRAIKYLLAKEQGHQGNTTETGGYHYSMEEMLQLGQHCSMAERRADEATRDVADWLKCDFMLDQVGNVFKGVISSVTGFGFFVRLDDLFIDGLVHVSSLDNDYYRFDQVGQRLMGESSGQTYRLGDRVEVRVEAVNMDERKIDFSLISSERAPRNVGKTAREKAKKGDAGKKGGKRRQVGKKVNFEPDSAFRGEKKPKPKAAKKDVRKAKKPSAKTRRMNPAWICSPLRCLRTSPTSWQSTPIRPSRTAQRNGWTASTHFLSTRCFRRSSNCGG